MIMMMMMMITVQGPVVFLGARITGSLSRWRMTAARRAIAFRRRTTPRVTLRYGEVNIGG